ncbi:MAG: hypothetical protein K0Q49_1088 [Haloplasmataceae bacterium]|jgi:predicted RNA-binding protein YlqC (UPF0109 family)|nr:hypothetical protein [Haloplasmataceae bacterium]
MSMENLIKTLIEPLVENIDEVIVKEFEKDVDGFVVYEVMVSQADIGRVIGRNGSIAQAVRTICYAAAMKNKFKIRINIDHF